LIETVRISSEHKPVCANTHRHVFVLLSAELDVEVWRRRFADGEVPGPTPYGYHNAERYGYRVSFGRSTSLPHQARSLIARSLYRLFGFDLAHAWNNRRAMVESGADAFWAHTEREFLAILMLRRLGLLPDVPVISQMIWIADVWKDIGMLRRALFTWLMARAEICAFNSPVNEAFARERGWGRRIELVEFGISLESFPLLAPRVRRPVDNIRVLVIGNDRHRDWLTVHAAFANRPEFEVRVASTTYPSTLLCDNIVAAPGNQLVVRKLYEWSDLVVIPLHHNMHVSGSTVICESVAMGKPVVATHTGGLSHYFSHDQVFFVPIGGAAEMRAAAIEAMANPEATELRIRSAQQRMMDRQYTTLGYARRHVELTESVLTECRSAEAPQRATIDTSSAG